MHIAIIIDISLIPIMFLKQNAVDVMRQKFLTNDELKVTIPLGVRRFDRNEIYNDVVQTYVDDCSILSEYPLKVSFIGEPAVDAGGVCREMYSCFWESAYLKHFDGETLLIPACRPGDDLSLLTTLGTIVSHGFLVSGILPIRVAFPVLASILYGPNIEISEQIILESFVDYIAVHEGSLLRTAIAEAEAGRELSGDLTVQLITLFSRFDHMEVPTAKSIRRSVLIVAEHLFMRKSLGIMHTMHSGVPKIHKLFWGKLSVSKLFELFKAMNATASSMLKILEEPEFCNKAEQRVFNFFATFIGSCHNNDLRSLLRFITGSSVILNNEISVSFNSLSGLARRPISHTCSCLIELSTSYMSYPEFEKEMLTVLSSESAFIMDAM